MLTNFVKSYPMPKEGPAFKHTTMVRHNGTVIAFAVNDRRRILYSVLDLSEQPQKGPLDVNYWQDNPQELIFPNEIVTVGEALIPPMMMPVYKKESPKPEEPGARVKKSEIDLFRSTTASLSADAPILVLSDNKYVYVFRQSGANDSVNVNAGTLLVDRFVVSGTTLEPKREVRYQRSRNKYIPESRKDGLGAKDMEQQPFFEPTQKLAFIRNLIDGRFTVLLLPTQIAGAQRWQIFAHNDKTGMIDSFNIERASDGLFNLKGSQAYTCPDHPQVFSLQGGDCPEPAKADPTQNCPYELIPIVSKEGYAEWALQFDGVDDSIALEKPLPAGDASYQAIEFWLKPEALGGEQSLVSVPGGQAGGIVIDADGRLQYYYTREGDESQVATFPSNRALEAGMWSHVALVREADVGTLTWLIDGNAANALSGIEQAAAPVTELTFGSGPWGKFKGYLDEVRIWKRQRGKDEIREDMHHRLIGHEPGLVLYWRFDEGSGAAVHDQTENANHGLISGAAEWVESDAPLGDHPGVRRTSFRFDSREVVSGMTALLYYQQKRNKTGYDGQDKPLKTSARVMLAVATHPESGGEPGVNHIAALDFDLSRDGKLAQVPDNIELEKIEVPIESQRSSRVIQSEIEQCEQLINELKGKLDITADQPFLDAVFRKYGADEEEAQTAFVKENVTIRWSEAGTAYELDTSAPPKTLARASWKQDSSVVAEFANTAEGAHVSEIEQENIVEYERLKTVIDHLDGELDIPADEPFLDAVCWRYAPDGEKGSIAFVKDNVTITWSETGTEYQADAAPRPKTLARASWKYDSAVVAEFVNTEERPTITKVEPVSDLPAEQRIGTEAWLKAWTDWAEPHSGREAAFAFRDKYYFFKGDQYQVFDKATRAFGGPQAISAGVFPDLWPNGVDAAFDQTDDTVIFFKGPKYRSYQRSGEGFSQMMEGEIHDIFPDVPFLFLHPEYDGELPDRNEIEQQLAAASIGTPEWLAAWTDWENPNGGTEAAFALEDKYYYLKGSQYKVFDRGKREFADPIEISDGEFDALWSDGVDAACDQTDDTLIFFKGPKYRSYQRSGEGFSQMMEGEIHDIFPGVPFLFLHPEYSGELPNLAAQEERLKTLRDELAEAHRRELQNLEYEIKMHLVHTDPFGLTTMGGLLTFAWTVNAPLLFDSANGKLALYFQGANDQFYVAYYDTLTERVTFAAPAEDGTDIVFIPRAMGPVKDAVIQIAGEDAETCSVSLENPDLHLSESWQHVPRAASEFASVLNGLGAPVFLSRLEAALSGTVRSVKISAATPERVKPGRVLNLGADSAPITSVVPLTALAFDGVDDYIELPQPQENEPPLIGEAGTIEMWINFSGAPRNQTIFDATRSDSDPKIAKFFFIDIQGGNLRFWLEDSEEKDFKPKVVALDQLNLGADWHHLVGVWNYGGDVVVRLYLDGEQITSSRKGRTAKGCPEFLNPFVGKSRSGYMTKGMFAGQIAEVCIHAQPLTGHQVKASYELGLFGVDPELAVGCWRFQAVNGTPAALDFSPNKRDGTLHGEPALEGIDGGGIMVKIAPIELGKELAAGEALYTDYDYAANIVRNHRGREARSALFAVDGSQAKGSVQNGQGTLTSSGAGSPMTRWISYSQGSALAFDGEHNHVKLPLDAKRPDGLPKLLDFDAEGDLTLEAWVRPLPPVGGGFSRIVHHRSEKSVYLLGLEPKPLESAISLNGGFEEMADAWAAAQVPFFGGNWAAAAADAAVEKYKAGKLDEVASAARSAAMAAFLIHIHSPWFFFRSWRIFLGHVFGGLAQAWALSWLKEIGESRDHVEVLNPINLANASFTIEFWAKRNLTNRDDYVVVQGSQNKNEGLHIGFRDNNCFTFAFYSNDLDADPVYTDKYWHHWACTYDADTKQRIIYRDGVQAAMDTAAAHYQDQGAGGLYIGRDLWDRFFSGSVDEVRIWNVARTQEQINDNMRRRLRGNAKNLVGYWHFDGGLARDYSGNENHGIVYGTPKAIGSPMPGYAVTAGIGHLIEEVLSRTYIQTQEILPFYDWNHLAAVYSASYALHFADDGAFLDCGNNASLNLGDDLTIEAFFRLDDLGQPRGILTKGEIGPAYGLYLDTQGRVVFTFSDEDGKEHSFTTDAQCALREGGNYRVAVTRRHQSRTYDKEETRVVQDQEITIMIPEVEEWDDVEIHVWEWNGKEYVRPDGAGGSSQKYFGPRPGSNADKLIIGRASSRKAAPFKGIISEVRIWNRGLDRFETCKNITGAESGLVSWWRLDENEGYAAEDATGKNPALINLADWVKNPDPQGSSFRILNNGVFMETVSVAPPANVPTDDDEFSLGGRPGEGAFYGTLEELRIWRTTRTQEQIQDNLFLRLLGEKEDLIAYFQFDHGEEDTIRDHSFRGNDLSIFPSEIDPDINGAAFVVSDAPVSYDTFQVRNAISNALVEIKTAFHDQIHSQPGVQEYGDMQYDAEGNLIGVLKRCYSYIKNGQWYLVTGYKVGNLITEWIGQVQFNPELKGYVEGAPPVPSENLTAGPVSPTISDYTGITSVEVVEADNVAYTYATSKEAGLNASFGLSAQFGVDTTVLLITAPLGFGTAQEIADVNVLVGLEGKFDASAGWSSENSIGVGRNLTKSTKITLGGNWEDPTRPVNTAMRRRYQPANVGFALVQSETADVFALRLAHNMALVSYQFRPNPDIPKDWNIVPFPINPRYTKQGTLDGGIGFDERGKVVDPDYPNAREYGQHSYFKPKEAYTLKNRIIKEEQELANYFRSVDTSLGGAPGLAISAGLGLISGAAEGGPVGAIEGLIGALGSSGLPEKLGKQNIVNTYVWTADGGFFAETTETMVTKQESTSGVFSFSGEVGAAIGVDFSVGGVDVSLGFNAMLGGSVNLTKTKTKESENAFRIDVEADVPGDLQAYDEDLNRIYDNDGNPVIVPGKVDAYRFMTFYLEPTNENFDVFFNTVVDPIWLQGSHPNALALKQAQQASKKPPCWRVMHRVTFVSRILPEIPDASAPPLEQNMKAANVESNWQLIQKLEPFVRGKTTDFVAFSAAIRKAVEIYLPELAENVEEIIRYLSDYYQVYEA